MALTVQLDALAKKAAADTEKVPLWHMHTLYHPTTFYCFSYVVCLTTACGVESGDVVITDR